MRVAFTETAVADLESIFEWIARENPPRAAAFLELLRERCLQLGELPRMFPLVPRYESLGVRRRPIGDYCIFYRVSVDTVAILHVLHGARDYESLLFPDA